MIQSLRSIICLQGWYLRQEVMDQSTTTRPLTVALTVLVVGLHYEEQQ